MNLNINDTFNKELPADPVLTNSPRQVENACFSFVTPRIPSNPSLIHASEEVAAMLGIAQNELRSEDFLKTFSGSQIIESTAPYAMCYAGHQFGNWAGQLGDGRAINLGEVVYHNNRWAIQLKGSGATPYSRTADGLAVLRSSVREHLCSEAMYHLGVPTTRSLSLMTTGDNVLRDILYNGNVAYEKGAVVCRVAPSFIRFGNFQIFAARKDVKTLRQLTDYTIRHFFPGVQAGSKEGYLKFLETVAQNTLDLIIHWQRVGFVHGVMNTDNLSILGLTIDYGPYGWLEGYDPNWTPNTTDRQHKRYRYGNQARVANWNLYQLANALYPLIEEVEPLEEILKSFASKYDAAYADMMCSKLGLSISNENDQELIDKLETTLQLTEIDMTIFFRELSKWDVTTKLESDNEIIDFLHSAIYTPAELQGDVLIAWKIWFSSYTERLKLETASSSERSAKMNSVNPKYVLRNYMSQLAIDKADNGDNSLISELFELLKRPYEEQEEGEKWYAKRPEWARNKVGCSMLSCSS